MDVAGDPRAVLENFLSAAHPAGGKPAEAVALFFYPASIRERHRFRWRLVQADLQPLNLIVHIANGEQYAAVPAAGHLPAEVLGVKAGHTRQVVLCRQPLRHLTPHLPVSGEAAVHIPTDHVIRQAAAP